MCKKLKFKIDQSKELKAIISFSKDANFNNGLIVEWAIFNKYPELREKFDEKYEIKDINFLKKFIKLRYKKEGDIIKKNLEIYKNNWKKVENAFFELTSELFDGNYWPRGKYIAFPTIWGMFPRYLDDKTFQFPHRCRKLKYVNVIIAHEMLHFVFYEYFYKKYPKYKSKKYDNMVWNVAEIFNVVVQNSPRWVKIFKLGSTAYPMHEKTVKRLNEIHHRDNLDVDSLIKDTIGKVEEIKIG